MKKIQIPKAGGHEVLNIVECSVGLLKAGEVCIDVAFSGVNYADICIRWGIYESAKKFVGWPITPGFEFSGTVSKISTDSKFKVGDKVFGVTLFNGYSSCINVDEKFIYHLPKNLTLEQAACFPAVYLTAYHALFQNFVMRAHSNVLVHSAAGGVGTSLVQLLRAKGHNVVGVIGSSSKKEYLKNIGCENIIDKSVENLWQRAKLFCPNGFDIILDANGVETLKQSFNHLAPMGKLMVYGFHTMLPKASRLNWIKLVWNFLRTPRFSPIDLTAANKSILAFNLSFLFDKYEILNEAMSELIELVEQGKIHGHQVTVFDAHDIASAHGLIESGKSVGKIAIKW